MAQYTVRGPNGEEHVLEGPDDATDDEIAEQAELLFGSGGQAAASVSADNNRAAGIPAGAAPVDFSGATMLENVPESAGAFAKNLIGAIAHPIDTATAIKDLAWSGASHLSKALGSKAPIPEEDLVAGSAFADMMNKRYGSMDAFKRTLMEDPVGAAADIAGIMTAGGGLAAKATMIPQIANAGRNFAATGAMLDPLMNATRAMSAVGKAAMNTPLLKDMPRNMYRKAAGFKTDEVADLALARGINPASESALSDVKSQMRAYGAAAQKAVDESNKTALASEVLYNTPTAYDMFPNAYSRGVPRRTQYVKEFDALADELGYAPEQIVTSPLFKGGQLIIPEVNPDISMSRLHELKKSSWGDTYRNGKSIADKPNTGKLTAEQEIGRSARRILETTLGDAYAVPNQNYGELAAISRELPRAHDIVRRGSEAASNLAGRRIGGSAAFGAATGQGALSAALAAASGIAGIATNPARRVGRALALENMRTGPVQSLVKARTGALADALAEIAKYEEERQKRAIRGR